MTDKEYFQAMLKIFLDMLEDLMQLTIGSNGVNKSNKPKGTQDLMNSIGDLINTICSSIEVNKTTDSTNGKSVPDGQVTDSNDSNRNNNVVDMSDSTNCKSVQTVKVYKMVK